MTIRTMLSVVTFALAASACTGQVAPELSPQCRRLDDGRTCTVDGLAGHTYVCPEGVDVPPVVCGEAAPFWTGPGWIQACCVVPDQVSPAVHER